MRATVNSNDDYNTIFSQYDTVKSVIQNILLLLNTKRGSVPMHRDFGLPMEFVDKPHHVAEAIAVREITDAIEKFEPRAKLIDLKLSNGEQGEPVISAEIAIDN